MTKDEILQIPALKQKGTSHKKIAQKFKISVSAVDYWCKKLKEAGYDVPRLPHSGGRKKIEL
jgi:transposase